VVIKKAIKKKKLIDAHTKTQALNSIFILTLTTIFYGETPDIGHYNYKDSNQDILKGPYKEIRPHKDPDCL
jgi:hypothetical protein